MKKCIYTFTNLKKNAYIIEINKLLMTKNTICIVQVKF